MPHALPSSSPAKSASPLSSPGTIADIRRQLLAEEGLTFSSLVVRRVADCICLEGVLEIDTDDIDVDAAALRIAAGTSLRNQLIVRNADSRCCELSGAETIT